ncbi:50S ribosomal protein L30e [Nanoarchaeota archaeon]|nr:MAG: 50S ribosomal protein L30e [Nanoarchaeota archaeon]
MKLEEAVNKGKVIFGKREVEKALRRGEVEEVIVARNCPAELREEIESLAKDFKIKVREFPGDNEELGIKCKRQHLISIVAIVKGNED